MREENDQFELLTPPTHRKTYEALCKRLEKRWSRNIGGAAHNGRGGDYQIRVYFEEDDRQLICDFLLDYDRAAAVLRLKRQRRDERSGKNLCY